MKLKLFLIAVLVAGGLGAAFLSLGGLSTAASATTYLTSTAAIGTVSDDVAATGTIESTDRYGLAFGSAAHPVADSAESTASNGTTSTWGVISVEVEPGDVVKAGDVLATGDPAELQADSATAAANRRSAQIQFKIAKEQLADAEDADNTDAIRQAQIAYYTAESQLAQARATETDLKAQIARATLLAPIDGIVSEVNISAGSDAPSGDAVVVEARTFEVTTDVVESDISAIAVGQPATITVTALGEDVEGTVTAIAPSATSGESGGVVSFAVTVQLTDVPATLRAGMSAEATITTASAADVLTVPSAALNGSDGSYTVRVLDASGTPLARAVSVGLVTSALAEITDGLAAGDVVVTGTTSDLIGTTQQRAGGTLTGGGAIPGGGGAIPGGGFR
jgi:membrane fusion protein, macrolide-specific efflux system